MNTLKSIAGLVAATLLLAACKPNNSPATTKLETKSTSGGVVLQPGEGEQLIFRAPPVPDPITIKVSPRNGSSRFAMGTQDLPVDYVVPIHQHEQEDEILFFHLGHGTATLNDKEVAVEPGTTIFIPHGVWHGVHNTSTEPAQMVWFVSAPGLENFFREASQPPGTPWTPLPPDVLNEIARKHGTIFKADHAHEAK
jgi:quercetin dioxygenase-like cupin family protein